MNENPKRRWYQFSLKILLIGITIVALALGAVIMRAERQRAALARVKRHALVRYSDSATGWFWPSEILRKLLPGEYVTDVIFVSAGDEFNDSNLADLHGARLIEIELDSASLTNDGLRHLRAFTTLSTLRIANPRVTDKGLSNVQYLPQLRHLDLHYANVTDDGLAHLQGLTELRFLTLHDTRVTDKGLVHLKNLTKLEYLLVSSPVTDSGIAEIEQALPNCVVTSVPRSGLSEKNSDDRR